jgi:hypothetical protein
MQVVLAKDFVMDNSHSFLLSDLPISTGEKFTVIIMRDETIPIEKPARKVFAHRIAVNSIDLPTRDDLHER